MYNILDKNLKSTAYEVQYDEDYVKGRRLLQLEMKKMEQFRISILFTGCTKIRQMDDIYPAINYISSKDGVCGSKSKYMDFVFIYRHLVELTLNR